MLIPVFSLWAHFGCAELLPSEVAYCSLAGGLDSDLDFSPCLQLGQGHTSSEP